MSNKSRRDWVARCLEYSGGNLNVVFAAPSLGHCLSNMDIEPFRIISKRRYGGVLYVITLSLWLRTPSGRCY
jgi:hypothetical protein